MHRTTSDDGQQSGGTDASSRVGPSGAASSGAASSPAEPAGHPPPAPGGPALPTILQLELEDVLHSIYAARQDVLDLADSVDQVATRRSAERTLYGCAATVQLLLRLLRVVADDEPEDPFLGMMSGPFGVLGPDYEVLYFNTALRDLIGLQHRTIALSRFEDRRWIDRDAMAAHLARATTEGSAVLETDLTRSDGTVVPVRVRSDRVDEHHDPLLLVSLRTVDAADVAGTAGEPPAS